MTEVEKVDQGNAKRRKQKMWAAYKEVAQATKMTATLAAAITSICILIPPAGNVLNILTAWRFWVHGYVYYEISPNRTLEGRDEQLHLLGPGPGNYGNISLGDRLQAATPVNFRDLPKPDPDSAVMFVLNGGDCVTVLWPAGKFTGPFRSKTAVSAGWFWVATSACGLFK